MSKDNNLTDFLTDVADAIREKKGTEEKINPQNFSDEIKGIKTSSSMWTGHVDVEGLKAIGWDDEDIAYYQEHGVDWMEDDDEYHKVSDDNKALYGVLTVDNISSYKDRIVYLPKIDFSSNTSMAEKFRDCRVLVATPFLDLKNARSLVGLFRACINLKCTFFSAPNAVDTNRLFYGCSVLTHIPKLDCFERLSVNTNSFSSMFESCGMLSYFFMDELPVYNSIGYLFYSCKATKFPKLDMSKVTTCGHIFNGCIHLNNVEINNLHLNISFSNSIMLHKTSLLHMINNEAATEVITITLHAEAYARLSTDPDIVAALENHPLVSLASA